MKNVVLLVAMIALACVSDLSAQTKAPTWDTRGVGPLPWQGVSALHISADGNRIVLGTIAPAEDPHVIVLDVAGKVVAHHAVGQRWIESVAALPDGASVMALCTHADGKANDFPTVFIRGAQTLALPPLGTQEGFATASFHYGDHSNHLGMKALNCTDGIWVNAGKSALWYPKEDPVRKFAVNLPVADDVVGTAAAALPNGIIILGHAAVLEGEKLPDNLHVLQPNERKPLWSRAALNDLPPVAAPEKGAYGAPTRSNGENFALEQWDVPVSAPLSIALHAAADSSLARVATADYRGWQRWVRSSAAMNAQHIGTRFMPSRPVVSVHDAKGALVRRFESEKFAEAAWLDLRFLSDGKRLVAWPHRWNSRGLGGSAFLPADADARAIYLLDVESGDIRTLRMPDAVADLALTLHGEMIVSCWDGTCHRLGEAQFVRDAVLPKPVQLGGAALLAVSRDDQVAAARADGVVIGLDSDLRERWRCDLNQSVPHAEKPWIAKAAAEQIALGLWGIPRGGTESDFGGQRVIEAPDGLILIEAHAALSFEREWATMKQAGLDPMRVKFVLATHEHGDHAPGAYLWRVTTGAKFVCSEEMAYTLQHHIPLNSGYGFHPPVPTDIRLTQDTELDLAGLKVRAIRAPGHTAGSMAWSFEKDGKRFLATGDLIMPHGRLGYSGSINFSARDVLASLRKLQDVHADFILPGHGPILPPATYLDEGIETGMRTGWEKIPPILSESHLRITQPDAKVHPDIFHWADTCNVWVLRDGDAAVLVNLGDGSVLEHLHEIGVKRVEWVIFTDHHRELCQGIARLDRSTTKVAASKDEQELLENPLQFRKWRPTLGDKFTVHGASFVRPSAAPIRVDRALANDDVFAWRGHELTCLSTPGHSPGGMSFVMKKGDRACAFTGGLMHDGARMSNWFDTEWDYGFAKGLDSLIASVERVIGLKLDHAFPSQGPAIADAHAQFQRYAAKLAAFRPDYIRGYPVQNLTERKPDTFVKPTAIPQIVQVTPHLYKFSDMLAGKNFSILIADSGRALLLDCGIFPEILLHSLVEQMKTHLGLKGLDALWINHMHGDHFTLGAALKKHYGVKIWTLERIVDPVENPLRYDYCALITSYHREFEGLKIDRPIRDGEVIEWEGYKLHVDWMPGQTEFGNCLWLELDGKRIAFTGDNIFGDPTDPAQNGHEAVVARNSSIFEEGYFPGSRYIRDLKPDIIMGAHNVLMVNPAAFLARYHEWSQRIIAQYRGLIPDRNYEYGYDPFWVRAYPYRVDLRKDDTQTVQVTVRNFRDTPQKHRVELKLPPGIEAEPRVLEGTVAAKSRQTFHVKLMMKDRSALGAGVRIVPFDITLDGKRHGELFDFIVLGRGATP